MITPAQLIDAAQSWIGVPYMHQGRTRFGVDCVGLPVALLKELGVMPRTFKDFHTYGRDPGTALHPLVARYCERIDRPIPGCLVMILWPQVKEPTHVGIIGYGTIIHAYRSVEKVVMTGFRGQWRQNFHSAWKLPGVMYV